MVKCQDVLDFIESIAPASLAEDWDNVGLMVGGRSKKIEKILVCLDVTKKVVDEAISIKADLILSHHPFIFKSFKKIDTDNFKGNLICKLLKNDINVLSAHTNLDFVKEGVNEQLAHALGLKNLRNLMRYKSENLYKIVVFVPIDSVDAVREAISEAGAGWIGNYSDCTFMTAGTGTFKPLEGTNPYIGQRGRIEKVDEYRLESVVPQRKLSKVIKAMLEAHPYEEPAYDIYLLDRKAEEYGYGRIGTLENPQSLNEFVALIKQRLDVPYVRLIGSVDGKITKVAVFCGGFDEDIIGALKGNADVLVTGDVKYNTAVDLVQMGLCVIDAGHYNTERVIVPKLVEMLQNKFPEISVVGSREEENPITFC